MRTLRALPLTQRLLLTVLVPVSLLSVLISMLYLNRAADLAEQATRDRGIAIVSFLAPAAEYGVISGSVASLRSLLAAARAQQDVVAAAIYDRSRELSAVTGSPAIADLDRVAATVAPRPVGVSAGRHAFAAAVLSLPIAVDDLGGAAAIAPAAAEPEIIGWVYVELDTRAYVERRRTTALTVLALALATMMGTAVLAVRLARSVGEPVGRLVEAVRRMAAGDLDVRVSVGGGGQELSELQQGFNNMARSIADATYNLQARVEEATGQLAYQALHDPLTGLPNRRAFEQALEEMVVASRRADDRGALCFIDLDRFKVVNDTAGHAAGDALLRKVADLIRQRLRAEDIVCRIGGDEFAMILRGCTSADAYRIANGLCEAVHELRFVWEGSEFRIGASIGFAIIDGTMESVAEVLHAADHACYAVKRQGRGRVMEYQPELPASSAG